MLDFPTDNHNYALITNVGQSTCTWTDQSYQRDYQLAVGQSTVHYNGAAFVHFYDACILTFEGKRS